MRNEMIEIERLALVIHRIRGAKVILDRDLAELNGVKTRALKQAVRRNRERFPEDFMFVLTKEELSAWRSQNVMSKEEAMGLRHLPMAFTEQRVLQDLLPCLSAEARESVGRTCPPKL